jgi:hypothetical protein
MFCKDVNNPHYYNGDHLSADDGCEFWKFGGSSSTSGPSYSGGSSYSSSSSGGGIIGKIFGTIGFGFIGFFIGQLGGCAVGAIFNATDICMGVSVPLSDSSSALFPPSFAHRRKPRRDGVVPPENIWQ